MCVADTIDAITSDRPYRKALADQVAIEELKRCSGLPFDPSLVPQNKTEGCEQFDPKIVQALLDGLQANPVSEQSPGEQAPSAEDVIVRAFIEADDRAAGQSA